MDILDDHTRAMMRTVEAKISTRTDRRDVAFVEHHTMGDSPEIHLLRTRDVLPLADGVWVTWRLWVFLGRSTGSYLMSTVTNERMLGSVDEI